MARKTSRSTKNETVNEAPAVNSAPETTTEQRAAETAQPTSGENTTMTPNASILTLRSTNKSGKTAAYVIPGQVGSVRVAKSAVTNETFPASFADLVFKQPDQARVEKQAKKAERRALTAQNAEQRAATLQKRIEKAQAAAEKNAAKLAKLQQRLAPKSAQEQTEAAAAGISEPVGEEVGAEA